MSDLVERLKERAHDVTHPLASGYGMLDTLSAELMREAAEALEDQKDKYDLLLKALLATDIEAANEMIERLSFECDQLHKQYLGLQEDHQKASEELEAIACRCRSRYDIARVPYSRGDGLWACSTCGKVRASKKPFWG